MMAKLFTKTNKKIDQNKDDQHKDNNNNNNIDQSLITKLERVSLLDTYNIAKSKGIRHTLWWFLKNITINEPTFKRLLMIYRQIPESFVQEQTRKMKERANKLKHKIEKSAKKQFGLTQKDDDNKQLAQGVVDEIGRKRKASLFDTPDLKPSIKTIDDTYLYPIRIQYFSDVPMSDLEIVYPCKRFSLKPIDQIYITFTIFIGIYAILKELLFNGANTAFGSFMILTSIFLMIRSIIWYRSTESEYVRVLNQALVESNISTDQDTMLSLMDSVDEQQFMETILAYFVLLKNKDEVITDSNGVDRLCEKFMRDEFGSDVNVMIEGAMNKLTELGLFESGGMSMDESIKVKELLDALSCVHQHYQSAIQSVRKITINTINASNDQDDDGNNDRNNDEDQKRDIDQDKIIETPPIIGASQISDDHFDGGSNDNEFTPID